MDKKRVTELSIIANNVRKHALTAVYSAASGHPGGSLSVADVLTLLYFEVMNVLISSFGINPFSASTPYSAGAV